MKKILAFTLAEILIVLGIVGFIAEVTIPTIVANAQKQQYVTGLKKAYSALSGGIKLIMADEGVFNMSQTSLLTGGTFSSASRQNNIDATIRKYFKVIKSCKSGDNSCAKSGYRALDYKSDPSTYSLFGSPSPAYVFYTLDNMYFAFYPSDTDPTCMASSTTLGKIRAWCGQITVDINGSKKPNVDGRDVFSFWIGQDGVLYPYGGIDYAIILDSWNGGGTELWSWKSNFIFTSCSDPTTKSITNSHGQGCSAQIMEEGWEMNY